MLAAYQASSSCCVSIVYVSASSDIVVSELSLLVKKNLLHTFRDSTYNRTSFYVTGCDDHHGAVECIASIDCDCRRRRRWWWSSSSHCYYCFFIHIYWCDVVYHDLYHIYSHDIMIVIVVNTMLYNRVKATSELIGSHSQLLSLPYWNRSRHSRGCPEAM